MDRYVKSIELLKILEHTGVDVCLVSKYWAYSDIMKFYHAGFKKFGESRIDALIRRAQNLPKDIEWHFIGNIQSRDIGKICKYAKIIQSFDRPDLLAKLVNYPDIEILVQVNISGQNNRNGVLVGDLDKVIEEIEKYEVTCNGFMIHPPLDSSIEDKKYWFEEMQRIFSHYPNYTVLSMGTSHDFKLANEFGATLNRLGRILLGKQPLDE